MQSCAFVIISAIILSVADSRKGKGNRQLHLSHSETRQQIAKLNPPGAINAWLNERTLRDVCFTQVAVTCATHSTSKGSQQAFIKGCPKGKVSSACLRANVDNVKLGQLDIHQGGPIRVFYVPSIKKLVSLDNQRLAVMKQVCAEYKTIYSWWTRARLHSLCTASGGVKLQWATMLEVFCTANYGDNMKLLEKSFFQDGELALICNEQQESPEYGVGENLWDWGAPIEVKELDKEELKVVKTVQDVSRNEGQSIYIKATNAKGCNYAEAPFSCQADTRWPDANDARAGSSFWWVPAMQDMKCGSIERPLPPFANTEFATFDVRAPPALTPQGSQHHVIKVFSRKEMILKDNVKEIFQRVQQSLTLNEKNVDVKGDEEENMVLDFTHHLLEDDVYRVNTRV